MLGGKEIVDRLLEAASEQLFVPLKWDQAMPGTGQAGGLLCFRRQMEAVNRIQEEQCPDPLVETFAAAPKSIELRALAQQLTH